MRWSDLAAASRGSLGHNLPMTYTLAQLRQASDDELISRHDALAESTVVGVSYYLEELARRDAARTTANMLAMTWSIRALTWMIAVLTFVNVILVGVSIFTG